MNSIVNIFHVVRKWVIARNDMKACGKIVRQLLPHKIDVISALDISNAYLKCFSEKPDVILLDLYVPGVECEEALASLKRHPFVSYVMFVGTDSLRFPYTLGGK